jgi:hypothetical protein
MSKKTGIFFFIIIICVSCSNYSIKREIRNSSSLSKLKSLGIIIRLPHNSPVPLKLYNKNLTQWLEPYEKKRVLTLLRKKSDQLHLSKTESDRFMQFSSSEDFQYYQSMGIIKLYLDKNKEELDKLKAENSLDGLVIYEIDTFLSPEMQIYNFGSLIAIVDANYQVIYLDHQFDKYKTLEIDRGAIRENLLDEVSNRFIDLMLKLDFIREK